MVGNSALSPLFHEPFRMSKPVLEPNGCVTIRHGSSTLEIYEQDLSEHYLITVDPERQPVIDVVYLTGNRA
jgi:hypothetical protein